MAGTTIPLPVRSALLGVLSGARSATPMGMLALAHDRASLDGAWRDWPMFRSQQARSGLVLALVGELVADKLPRTPFRTKPGPLVGRITAGATTGGALGTLGGAGALRLGVVLGAAGAVVGSFTGAALRSAGTRAGLPDLVVALVEDAITIAATAAVIASA